MKRVKRYTSTLLIVVLLLWKVLPYVCEEYMVIAYGAEISTEMTSMQESSTEEGSTEETLFSTVELDQLMDSETKPSAPKKEIKEDKQNENQSGGDNAYTEFATELVADQILDHASDAAKAEKARLVAEESRLRKKGTRKLAEAKEVSKGKAQRLEKKGNNCINRADELTDQIDDYNTGIRVMDWVSIGMDAYSIYDDMQDLQDLQNEHSSFRAMEAGSLIVDAGFAAASIAMTIMGVTPAGWFVWAGIAVSAISGFLHSETFSNWANSQDNAIINALDEFIEWLLPFMKTPDGVGCYKPNIYIYSKDGKKITVKFKYPQLLTTTIPDYSGIWSALTLENGQLAVEENVYDYLFYESVTSQYLFQTEEGYFVPASNREETFRTILNRMGFTEKEITDFVEFWCGKLEEKVDYVMYPQQTEIVDVAMPVTISPAPEQTERIWFVFEVYEGETIQEPETIVLDRTAEYTVVEWGGMIFE